ncbi:hypothetical protein [Sphaerisporangium corydalis]|uniref:Uncharacterized protein n=1 Tax=Sphaerisporangium corydalis TaxID=1441875 RepID=A0ABV9EIR5_9ACTN|nr:hypothetical protein [Sphaerisporangium corydalis]
MKNLLRLLAVQASAAALVLVAVPVAAHADTPPTDAQLAAAWKTALDTYKFTVTPPPPAPGSGRSRAKGTISIVINAPITHVFPVYSNFKNHLGLHSFLKRIVTHKTGVAGGKTYNNFTAIEDIPFEGAIVTNYTHAQQRIDVKGLRYETDTWSLPSVFTHQKIVFKKLSGNKTQITEQLIFDTDTSLIDVALESGVSSHKATQAGLKAAIESGAL